MSHVDSPVEGFVPPPYPYDRLDRLAKLCTEHDGGLVDLSVGTPCDPPPPAVVAALASSDSERGYPPSIGTPRLRGAIRTWISSRVDVDVSLDQIAACIGTKEFGSSTPQDLKLRSPGRDT
ncbi:MAG: succinyldiaminopimelate transaminase, partial [Ilumatobacteraceae bacterium]